MLQCDGQEQIRILARGDTNRDQATIHQYYQVPDTIIQLTVDGVRRLPRGLLSCWIVGVQPAAQCRPAKRKTNGGGGGEK